MAERPRIGAKMVTKHLNLEGYATFYKNHPYVPPSLNTLQLHEIIHLHGYAILKTNQRRGCFLEALNGIDILLNPHRSTLSDTLSSSKAGLTPEQVNADLTALKWQDNFPVESLQSLSFTNNNSTDVDEIHLSGFLEKRGRRRVKNIKQRKVFDAVHLTKPRSKNCAKRKCLSDIIDLGRLSACLG